MDPTAANPDFNNKFLNFINNVNNIFSSKELCALGGLIGLFMCAIASIFFKLNVAEFIFDGFLYLTFGSLGLTIPEILKKL